MVELDSSSGAAAAVQPIVRKDYSVFGLTAEAHMSENSAQLWADL